MKEHPESHKEQKISNIRINDRRRVRVDDEPATGGEAADPKEGSGVAPSEPEIDDLTKARRDAETHLDDLKRLKAEFENYRKRVLKEQTEIVERASVGIIGRLLNVLDNFELAVASAEATHDFDRMLKGVEMVFGELKEVLYSEGLSPIDAKGKAFDPNIHEAALEVPGTGDEPVVAEVLRPGYTFKGRVLRPAMVKVAAPRERSGDGGAGESG